MIAAAGPANDNGRLPAIIDLGVEVFAAFLAHLEAKGSITTAQFCALVRRRCGEATGSGGLDRPEVAALLQIADDLSPPPAPQGDIVAFLRTRDDGRA